MQNTAELTLLTFTSGVWNPMNWNMGLTVEDAKRICRDFKHYKLNGGASFFEYDLENGEFMIDFATVISASYVKLNN